MTATVVVPLSTDDPDRFAAWWWVQARWQDAGYQTVTGTCEGNWCKARAVADAISKTDADTLIISDADVWVSDLSVVEQVADGTFEWAVPHRRVYRLSEQATKLVLAGADVHETASARGMLAQASYDGMVGGGVVVIRRELYERVPLDPRFVGWGGEDESWGRALKTLAPRRTQGAARLWHLFHKPQERMNRRMGSVENRKLTERYIAAAGESDAMRALIEEARCHSTASASAT